MAARTISIMFNEWCCSFKMAAVRNWCNYLALKRIIFVCKDFFELNIVSKLVTDQESQRERVTIIFKFFLFGVKFSIQTHLLKSLAYVQISNYVSNTWRNKIVHQMFTRATLRINSGKSWLNAIENANPASAPQAVVTFEVIPGRQAGGDR